ncbi:UbiA-like polyprenyltransferase [Acidipila sp. EB88]|uniref:UbiA-like polyprenyltransferase n=1 Tax=Acidipila sp. EB88 TaxID=2305226 RepID=UPI000F5DBEE7|nr:UbiA-like polyprenyltransferase [Acidipila sp. EB88]RRA47291.1 4-hydroxybenzoate octaprenyltransferase [Acidipila sp. EB88]
MALLRSVGHTLEMIKWEHSVFALPFALTAAVLAADGWPHPMQIVWIIVCMVTARSAAMAFNRWADSTLDAANPRTSMRAIPAGTLSRNFVGGFVLVSALLFVLAASRLNMLTLLLSPVALGVVLLYSYTKRFTRWSHVFLGVALGIAPAAAWIAIRGSLDPRILTLAAAVLFWVGGFDVFYSCQDAEHDRASGLYSVPATLGIPGAFWVARIMHCVMLLLLVCMVQLFGLGLVGLAAVALVAMLLLYEHSIISPRDLSRMNAAFFTLNGVISIVFFVVIASAVWVGRHHSA